MKRTLLFTGSALGAAACVAVVYSRLTSAAPAPVTRGPDPASAEVVSALPGVPAAASEVAPLTSAVPPETERLEARRVLYESVDALLQASEFERARRQLDDDQARYGDDSAAPWRDLETGYRLMADCLEHPNARDRMRAEAFLLVSEAHAISGKLRQACRLKAGKSGQ